MPASNVIMRWLACRVPGKMEQKTTTEGLGEHCKQWFVVNNSLILWVGALSDARVWRLTAV